MSVSQIIFIRHAEEHDEPGLTEKGTADDQSLTVRGWQRAGALAGFFVDGSDLSRKPDVVYASCVAPGSESQRPGQTVAPLVALMRGRDGVQYVDAFAKPQTDELAADILTRFGTVLVCWEHSRIAECIAALPHAPKTPEKWPSERYDLLWRLQRANGEWTFKELPQMLLSGDAAP